MIVPSVCMLFAAAVGGAGSLAPATDVPMAELAVIDSLILAGRYQDAEVIARQHLARAGEGASSIQADLLDLLVQCLYQGGKRERDETWELAERAVQIREAEVEPSELGLARSLDNLAALHQERREWEQARLRYERSLTIRQRELPADDPEVARSLHRIGTLLREKGDLEEAESYLNRALAIRRQPGGDPRDLANTLRSLAGIPYQTGDYSTAKRLFGESLSTLEPVVSPDHPQLAIALYNMAMVCHLLGEYEEALGLYQRSLSIRVRTLGEGHPNVSWTVTALATLLHAMGDYAEARVQYRRALAGQEELAETHSLRLHTLTSFADLLQECGEFEEARELHERALDIRRQSRGPDHPEVAISLSSLGSTHHGQGNLTQAKKCFAEAISIQERALGPEHPDLALSLVGYGGVLLSDGAYAEAREVLARALEITQATHGPEHPRVAWILSDLARVAEGLGDHESARQLQDEALEVLDWAPGGYAPLRADVLCGRARTLIALGRPRDGFAAALEGQRLAQGHLGLVASTVPERQALTYAARLRDNLDLALSILVATDDRSTGDVAEVWDALVRSRGLVLEEMAERSRISNATGDPELRQLAADLRSASQSLADLVVGSGVDLSPDTYTEALADARDRREEAEEALAVRSRSYRVGRSGRRVTLNVVARDLPPRTALIAYVFFHRYRVSSGIEPSSVVDDAVPSYLAFVMGEGSGGEARVIDLGSAAELDRRVQAWRETMAGPIESGSPPDVVEARYREVAAALREACWDPLTPHLGDVAGVLLVPDGAMHHVNPMAFPVGADRYLVEDDLVVHLLTTERDVVRAEEPEGGGTGLLALGGAAFDAEGSGQASDELLIDEASGKPARSPSDESGGLDTFRIQASGGPFAAMRFSPLPGTDDEVREITDLWRSARPEEGSEVLCLTGAEASESAFKRLASGRGQVHLATHGFFLTEQLVTHAGEQRGVGLLELGPRVSRPIENPLLRSGLALAGANQRDHTARGGEDGILTAEEIATLDLSGVEWAVLSACDTGVGEVRVGEGIFGLRRAFLIAGVKTIVMSLWQVQDESARDWMRALYAERLLRGRDAADAVRNASLEILETRREAGDSSHPFHWAAFLAVGEWR